MSTKKYSISQKHVTSQTVIHHLNTVQELFESYNIGDTSRSNKYMFITDATVASQSYMQDFISKFDDDICGNDALFVLGSGEPYKNIETIMTIIENAISLNFSRDDKFIGIGGGVICDLTTFAAALYKKGVAVDLVPTTLLAMVDSSIGGKVSCNHSNHKNIIGTTYTAENIFFIPEFLDTLSDLQFKSGIAEAFKTALVYDKETYELFKNKSDLIKARDKDIISEIIYKCVEIKANLVSSKNKDETKAFLLNTAHTFAYALETVCGVGVVTHGEAVAWGISRIVSLSLLKGYCLESFKNEVINILENFEFETSPSPSIIIGGGISERILNAMHVDKKNVGENIMLIIPKNVEDTVFEPVDDKEILAVLK